MTRKNDDYASILILLIVFLIAAIYYLLLWIKTNWIPIVAILLIIGAVYCFVKYQKDKSERLKVEKKKIEEKAILEAERKERENNLKLFEEIHKAKKAEEQELEKKQRESGLFRYINRDKIIKWGTPQEIDIWKQKMKKKKSKIY